MISLMATVSPLSLFTNMFGLMSVFEGRIAQRRATYTLAVIIAAAILSSSYNTILARKREEITQGRSDRINVAISLVVPNITIKFQIL